MYLSSLNSQRRPCTIRSDRTGEYKVSIAVSIFGDLRTGHERATNIYLKRKTWG